MNDQQWDDYIKRAPHTLYGEMGRTADSAFTQRPVAVPPRPVAAPVSAPQRSHRETGAPVDTAVFDPQARKRRAENAIAGILMLAVWASLAYSGLAAGGVQWYLPVGGGFVVGWLVYRVLVGPLRFLLVGARWAIQLALYAALLIGILAALGYLRNAS